MSIAEARIIQARLRPNPVLSVGGNYLDILGARLQSVHQRCRANRDARPCGLCLESGGKSQERIAVVEASKAVSRLERLNSTRAFVLEVQSGATDLLLAKWRLNNRITQ